jgi:ribosomal protein L29
MRFDELKNKTLSESYELLGFLKKSQLALRFQRSVNAEQVKPHVCRGLRRDVARVKTRIHQLKTGRGG